MVNSYTYKQYNCFQVIIQTWPWSVLKKQQIQNLSYIIAMKMDNFKLYNWNSVSHTNLGGTSALNLGILGKIDLFVYYGRAFHYQQLKKISLYDKNGASGMHFSVEVYRMTQKKWATKWGLNSVYSDLTCMCNKELFLFDENPGAYIGLHGNNG